MSQLREQMAEVLKAKRARKSKTRTNERYLKMSRKQLEIFLEQEKRIILGGSITRFVIEPDASDEEKGKAKREQIIAKMDRDKNRRERKRKAQKKAKTKRKAAETQLLIHIDEMMNHDSGAPVKADSGSAKARRKDRHKMTEMVTKAKLKVINHQTEVRQIKDRKWETGGKSSMAKWLRSGSNGGSGIISSNGIRISSNGSAQQQLRPFSAAAPTAASATARKRGKKKAGSATEGRDWEKVAKTTSVTG